MHMIKGLSPTSGSISPSFYTGMNCSYLNNVFTKKPKPVIKIAPVLSVAGGAAVVYHVSLLIA